MPCKCRSPNSAPRFPRGALLVCTANAFADPSVVPALGAGWINTAAMELLPRITRAQAMDLLSTANLAGLVIIEGAAAFERGFPMIGGAVGRRHRSPRPRVRRGRGRGRATGHCHGWTRLGAIVFCNQHRRHRRRKSAPSAQPMSVYA